MTTRIALTLLVLALCGCHDRPALTVYAASSLTDAFTAIGDDFQAQHPEVEVEFNFAGSQALRTQIEHGAPADVFVSANPEHAAALHDAGLVGEPMSLVHNELAMIVPTDSDLRSFSDLRDAERIVVGAPQVPVGRYTQAMLARAGDELGDAFVNSVHHAVASRESNVRLVLARVAMGEADAAVVYRTDAVAANDQVRTIEIPTSLNVAATYRIASTTHSNPAGLADAWIAFTRGDEATATLRSHGFSFEGDR